MIVCKGRQDGCSFYGEVVFIWFLFFVCLWVVFVCLFVFVFCICCCGGGGDVFVQVVLVSVFA